MTTGRVLHAGTASGPILRLDEPLSFWGGFDPIAGTIIDRAHPQVGATMAGLVVAMPGSRGSAGTPGVLGEAIRRGTGPAALLVTRGDANLVAGALVAAALYDIACPIVLLDEADFAQLSDGDVVRVDDGTISPAGASAS